MQQLLVDGIDLYIEGPEDDEHAETIVMIHGWPDTHRLWEPQVAALKHRYRCVRFTLPGFDSAKQRRAYTLDATLRILLHIVNSVNRQQPVILMAHDWGCVFGYEFYMRHRSLVSRIVGVDIGDANSETTLRSRTLGQRLMLNGYQNVLALAWAIGGAVGTVITRTMAGLLQAPSPRERIHVGMNYPYYILTAGSIGSYRALVPFKPRVPMLFIYGIRKPFMFHSGPWAEMLAARPGCKVMAFDTGHWPMVSAPQRFNQAVLDWLDGVAEAGASEEGELEEAQAATGNDAAA
ncbi:alpha/beta hydrolase [Duganella sp. Leaf126]|uniref:alpha/beta fold hydrolase n=1 Tax=Duganella sp. Leaf126 TaxID=1736266 RepID=UPI0006FE7475|nr:alpha/beta fold hydrolase [Duganella sp. Leaf126]KQQ45777.1 alpha/beta hydrolase [Duganella sp. Leaf126]